MARRSTKSLVFTLLVDGLVLSPVLPAAAQNVVTALVLRNGATGTGPASPIVLTAGTKVESAKPWTEIVFSDGSSIVLQPDTDFTLQGITRGSGNPRIVVKGTVSHGRLRVAASEGTDFVLRTGTVEVEVDSATADIEAGSGGSATFVSGRRVALRQGDKENTLRRPGFTAPFNADVTQRQSDQQLSESLDAFAPVTASGLSADFGTSTGTSTGTSPLIKAVGGWTSGTESFTPTPINTTSVTGQTLPGVIQTVDLVVPPGQVGAGVNGSTQQVFPPIPRTGGLYTLAQRALSGGSIVGAAIGAPGANSGTSVVATVRNIIDSKGQEGGLNVLGLTSIQKQSTGRVRRFAPAAAAGSSGSRNDLNVVAPLPTARAPGQPTSGVPSAYFLDLANQHLPRGQNQTFYDGVANVGIVTLRLFEPGPDPNTQTVGSHVVDVPRYYVTDNGLPSMAFFDPSYTVKQYNPGGNATDLTSPNGLQDFTSPELHSKSNSGTIFVTRITGTPGTSNEAIRLYRYAPDAVAPNGTVGEEVLIPPPSPGQTSSSDSQAFSRVGFDAYLRQQTLGPAIVYLANAPSRISAPFALHQPGAVFEIELQQRGNSPQQLNGPANGPVFALTGVNGLAVQVGGQALPGVQLDPANSGSLATAPGVRLTSSDSQRTFYSTSFTTATLTTPSEVVPDVFIIDKITASSDAIFKERGIQAGERYFVIGGKALPAPVDGGLPGLGGVSLAAGTVTQFAISDGLNPSGGFQPGSTIRTQFLGSGRPDQPVAFNSFNAFRPEETFIGYTTPGVPRGDTHLLVVAGAADRNPAMRTDIEVAANGGTSASAAVGGIARLPAGDRSLALSGAMVGSTRALGPLAVSTAITANLGSLGTDPTGSGTHLLGGAAGPDIAGQIGYFAIGQADTRLGAPGTDAGIQPGSLDTIGSASDSGQFAYTRLATNVGTPNLGASRGPLGGGPDGIAGFAAALTENVPAGGGSISINAATGANLGDVTMSSRNGDRELDATFQLAPRAAGEIFSAPPAAPPPAGRVTRTLSFGKDGGSGQPPTTAVASRGTFAAVIPGQAAMASVNSDVLNGIRRPDGTPSALPPSNNHVAWGFFLGDLVPKTAGGVREYANLGFWVAGRPVDYGTLQTLTGTATYQGGMIGNAVDGRGLRTVVGDFTHKFDFGRRQGTFGAQYDGAAFSVGTAMGAGANSFSGGGAGTLNRTLSAQGAFFHNAASGGAVSSVNLPVATGGVFGIAGPGYGANGVFVGARR